MKKFVLILLALMLCCSLAAAETTVTAKPLDRELDVDLLDRANMLTMRQDSLQHLADADLNIVSDGYYSITVSYNCDDALLVREPEKGLYGTIGLDGTVIVPLQYDELDNCSNHWTAGIMLKEATASNYDYKTLIGSTKYYLIDSVDIWFDSEKVGTLTRDEYRKAYAYGDYLCIRTRDDKYVFYNKAFEKSPFAADSSREYTEKKGVVTHNGTGQQAFTAGCTLTPAEVKQSVYYNYYDKTLVDLQGNVLADLSGYENVTLDSETGILVLTAEGEKKGLMDPTGKVIVECKYDDIGYNYDEALKLGWIDAEKDGKAGFVSLKDGTETGFEYRKDAVKQQGCFFQIEDPKSGKILISPLGEIPGTFVEAEPSYHAPYAVVKETEDSPYRVIGLDGKDVIPDLPEISSTYSVSFSYDGSLIFLYDKDYNKTLYLVSTAE